MTLGPFTTPGRFYRGNVHTHSDTSDGTLPAAEVVRRYRERGYDFVALTDHFLESCGWRITEVDGLGDASFTVIRGAELHAPGLSGPESIWHIVAVGLPRGFAANSAGETGPELAARALAAGAWVAAAHPAWYGATAADILSLGQIHAVETYNVACAELNDRGDSWTVYDQLWAGGARLDAYAADDAHFKGQDHLRAWVMVKAERGDADSLVAALKAGSYYSSTGPAILDVRLQGGELHVRCSPVARIYLTGLAWTAQVARGDGLTEAVLPATGFPGNTARLTLVEAGGGRAWTSPLPLGPEGP